MTSEGKTERVVVGVDGSEESASALNWAVAYARATGAAIRAVMAWHYPDVAGGPPVGVAPLAVSDEVERGRNDELARAVAAALVDSPGVEVEQKIAYGHASEVLIEESKDADLLVVGNRGHGAFTGLLLGSVSMHCVTHSFCPVTVFRTG